jgi:hypothetical protein
LDLLAVISDDYLLGWVPRINIFEIVPVALPVLIPVMLPEHCMANPI